MSVLLACWGLITIAAITDLRWRVIPNALFIGGIGSAVLAMLWGRISWWHLAWAAGTWAAYEIRMWLSPDRLGWGDVKLATVTTALLGGTGLFVIGMGHLGVYVWGTMRWLRNRRQTSWKGQAGPWAPGAWTGLTLLVATFILTR